MGFGFHIPYEDFEQIIAQLIEANRPESDFYIRPFLYSENEVIGVCYNGLTFNLGVYMIPLKSYYQSDNGLRLTISSWQKISDAAMSTKAKAGGCYVNSSMATTDARAAGYDEALMAVANSLTGVLRGAGQIECTINGVGERAGNAALEEVVMAMKTKSDIYGARTSIHTPGLVGISQALNEITGYKAPPNKAIVGKNALILSSCESR
jgi:hypothetical protein